VAVSREPQCLRAVELLHTGVEVDARVGVVHPERDVDRQPADRVDHRLEAPERGDRPVVDVDAEVLLDRLDHQVRAALDERAVDLVRPLAGDVDPRVAGDPHHRGRVLVGVEVDQVERVRERVHHVVARSRAAADREDHDRLGAREGRGVARVRLPERDAGVRCDGGRGAERPGDGPADPRGQDEHDGEQTSGHEASEVGDAVEVAGLPERFSS
jgi:hypothetical protein